jgi:hypothetical protein
MTVDMTVDGPLITRRARLVVFVALAGLSTLFLPLWPGVHAGAASATPAVTMTPATGGTYHQGQKLTLSVGPNHFFTPYSRIEILMCADRKGRVSNLPIDDSTCDGNTVQGNSVLVAKNGSFRETGYPVYSLPNQMFGEGPSDQPVCDRTHSCVLYVGQNQNSFKAPKIFSSPFTVTGSKAHTSG